MALLIKSSHLFEFPFNSEACQTAKYDDYQGNHWNEKSTRFLKILAILGLYGLPILRSRLESYKGALSVVPNRSLTYAEHSMQYGWSPVLQAWSQLLHYIQRITYFSSIKSSLVKLETNCAIILPPMGECSLVNPMVFPDHDHGFASLPIRDKHLIFYLLWLTKRWWWRVPSWPCSSWWWRAARWRGRRQSGSEFAEQLKSVNSRCLAAAMMWGYYCFMPTPILVSFNGVINADLPTHMTHLSGWIRTNQTGGQVYSNMYLLPSTM